MTDAEVAAVVLRTVCDAAGLSIDEVLAPGQLRTQVVPRRAAADTVRKGLGWPLSRLCSAFSVSRSLLLHPSKAHTHSELSAVCRLAAREAVAGLRDRVLEDARDDSNERRRRCGAVVREALAARCLEHGVTTAQALDASGLLQYQRRRATMARHAAVLDAVAAGVSRKEVARVLGMWPESVVRIVTAHRRAVLGLDHAQTSGGEWRDVGRAW